MESHDLQVLRQARQWQALGHAVSLATVVETWGTAPRRPGALLALRDDGALAGSVSGGCVEDDLIERTRAGRAPAAPEVVSYGVSHEQAARVGLPCGGTLRLLHEPLRDTVWLDEALARVERHECIARVLDLRSGTSRIEPSARDATFAWDGHTLVQPFGPQWRLLIVGAGQLSRALARMALAADFEVICCDPRVEYTTGWDVPGAVLSHAMPDDLAAQLPLDAHTAVAALSHDRKLDDLVLLEALKSPAFYVGALGSRGNQAARRERLASFDLSAAQIERLHGPIGLPLGGRAPAEIAVAVLAQIVAVRHGVTLVVAQPAPTRAAA